MTAKKRIKSKMDTNAVSVESTSLLVLLADIRAAVGDPTGKLMQDELVKHCRTLKRQHEWRGDRLDLLAQVQKHMRDPERTLVCDILANGQLLPDPHGKRYGFARRSRRLDEKHKAPPGERKPDGAP